MIVVVEDLNTHFKALQGYLGEMYPGEREVSRVQSEDEVEDVMKKCRKESIPLILIFDLLMEVAGGPHSLTRYVKELWRRKNDEWLARVPIVVWSVHVDWLQDLPWRARSFIVSKLESTGMGDLEEFEVALREAIA